MHVSSNRLGGPEVADALAFVRQEPRAAVDAGHALDERACQVVFGPRFPRDVVTDRLLGQPSFLGEVRLLEPSLGEKAL